MLKTKLLICIATWMAVTSAGAQTVTGNARYVDPFIGVDGDRKSTRLNSSHPK